MIGVFRSTLGAGDLGRVNVAGHNQNGLSLGDQLLCFVGGGGSGIRELALNLLVAAQMGEVLRGRDGYRNERSPLGRFADLIVTNPVRLTGKLLEIGG